MQRTLTSGKDFEKICLSSCYKRLTGAAIVTNRQESRREWTIRCMVNEMANAGDDDPVALAEADQQGHTHPDWFPIPVSAWI